MKQTLFDEILAGNIPADRVYEDEAVLAFRDIKPKAPIHILVIPKIRIPRFASLNEWNESECGRFFQRVAVVAEQLGLNDTGYRIVINNGSDGGQEVEYLHAHILGGRSMTWPPG